MSDEPRPTGTDSAGPISGDVGGATAEDATGPAPRLFGGVPEGIVYRGTTTWGHDQQIARETHEAEERRRAADWEKQRVAMDGAKVWTNKLSEHGQIPKAYVLLAYLTRAGEALYDHAEPVMCLADVVIIDPSKPEDLTLILVCPDCKTRLPQDHCQIQIRQSNRRWHLDVSTAGELIMFEGTAYRSAGSVMDSERFKCSQCGWQARIDKNRVWPC